VTTNFLPPSPTSPFLRPHLLRRRPLLQSQTPAGVCFRREARNAEPKAAVGEQGCSLGRGGQPGDAARQRPSRGPAQVRQRPSQQPRPSGDPVEARPRPSSVARRPLSALPADGAPTAAAFLPTPPRSPHPPPRCRPGERGRTGSPKLRRHNRPPPGSGPGHGGSARRKPAAAEL